MARRWPGTGAGDVNVTGPDWNENFYPPGGGGVGGGGGGYAPPAGSGFRAVWGAAVRTKFVTVRLSTLYFGGGGVLRNGYVELLEKAGDAPAPGANRARIYLTDTGAGKTRLVVRFNTGNVQVIATQP